MKITFIMAGPNMSGGDRVCAIYAQKLNALGHKINIIAPKKIFLSVKQQIKRILKGKGWLTKKKQMQNHFELLNLKIIYTSNFSLIEKDVPDADIIIATWWTTVEWISNFSDSKGIKTHFIQGVDYYARESLSNRIKKSWLQPFYKITIANFLIDILKKDFFIGNISLVPNGVDLECFFSNTRVKQIIPTIGFLLSEAESKGVRTALDVIQNLKGRIPNLRVVIFGLDAPTTINLPEYMELTINPNQDEISFLYQQCDLWLCCSLIEGFGLTILESMACGTPAVSTKCGGPEDIITQGVNGFLCDVNDIDNLSEACYEVLDFSEKKWQLFSQKSIKKAKAYSWDDATILFENALLNILNNEK